LPFTKLQKASNCSADNSIGAGFHEKAHVRTSPGASSQHACRKARLASMIAIVATVFMRASYAAAD
jgi:hypothetical protein